MNSKNSSAPTDRLPELLAPAGSPEALHAALRGGADAVYLGGTLFNARMNASNFTDDAMRAAVDACHARGARIYVTVNIALYDRELSDALRYAAFLYSIGVDALIVADLGFASLLQRYLPNLPIHASTQASGHNIAAAAALHEMGFSRMVCARELSRENIAALTAASPIGIEMFVHGAMCVCHSGQCLFSSLVGGRSGNRGLCAQPCRMRYQNGYPLSLRDLCLAGHIPEILSSGVESLKIEGRMKSPEYVYGVTRIWRRLLDEQRNATDAEMRYLADLFSRGGFTDGYYTGKIGQQMLGVRSEEDKAASRRVTPRAIALHDAPARAPIPTRHTEIPSLPSKNELRAMLSPQSSKKEIVPVRSARFADPEQIVDGWFDIVYLPLARCTPGRCNGVIVPPVIPDLAWKKVEERLTEVIEGGVRHLLITNLSQLALCRSLSERYGVTLHGDFRLNVCSNASLRLYEGLETVLVSPELSAPQVRDLDAKKGLIVYGRIPLMLTEKRVGADMLRDRTGAAFPILHGDRDEIVNSLPTYLCDKKELLRSCAAAEHHWIFTVENRRAVAAVIDASKHGRALGGQVRRIKS